MMMLDYKRGRGGGGVSRIWEKVIRYAPLIHKLISNFFSTKMNYTFCKQKQKFTETILIKTIKQWQSKYKSLTINLEC